MHIFPVCKKSYLVRFSEKIPFFTITFPAVNAYIAIENDHGFYTLHEKNRVDQEVVQLKKL